MPITILISMRIRNAKLVGSRLGRTEFQRNQRLVVRLASRSGAPPVGLRGHCRYCLIASQRASRKFGELLLGVMLENTPRLGMLAAALQAWQSATGGTRRRYTGLEGYLDLQLRRLPDAVGLDLPRQYYRACLAV